MRLYLGIFALVLAGPLSGCGSFDIVAQLEDQQKAIASSGQCIAPAPPSASATPAAAQGSALASTPVVGAIQARLKAVTNPLFGPHVLGGSLAERVVAYGSAAPTRAPARALAASLSSADPIVAVQMAFVQNPVGMREKYLANLGPLGQHELVRLAANILLTVRAHNLGKLGVVNRAEAQEAANKLRAASGTLSQDIVNAFATSTAAKVMSNNGSGGAAAAASPSPSSASGGTPAPTLPPPSPSAFEKLLEYYNAYTSSNGFILRDGSKLSRLTQTATTSGPDPIIINSETVLLEFLADYFLATPVFQGTTQDSKTKTTTTIYYPAGTATAPTATLIVDSLPISTNPECGVNAVKSQAINLMADLASTEMAMLAAPLIESFQGINLGVALAGVNLSFTAQTVQGMAKTFVEVTARRAVYALGTDVFIAARTGDLNGFLKTVLTAVEAGRPGGPAS